MSSVRGITVTPAAGASIPRTKADHWADASGKGFQNPWPSAAPFAGFWKLYTDFLGPHRAATANDPDVANFHNLVKQVKPDFGLDLPSNQVKATWLGHASFLVEMPASKEGGRGVNVLFDPAYSERCSPVSFAGSIRFSPPPAPVKDLPEIDIVAISHNHYDHCDLNTLKELYTKHADRPPVLFVGLNGAANLRSTVGAKTDIVEMDWWEDRIVAVEGKGSVKVTCTPCQHSCARTPFDKDKSLWASWALHSVDGAGTNTGASAWHAGDTGYCSVNEETHTIDPARPVCPAFKEIGDKLGPFSVGMIPIGAYAPRHIMSTVHNAPIDAVRMFKDTQCKKAIGMHWGTWRMAMDRIAEPPEKLVDARKEVGLTEEEFGVVALGETRGYEA